MNEMPIKEAVTAAEVASYLRRHTSFLKDFPDIALNLLVPRDQGSSTSLASYQLEVLREHNRELTRRLHDLIGIGTDNEQLMLRVHSLTLGLMRASSLAETAHQIAASLTEDFQTELVRLVLFRNDADLPAVQWLIRAPHPTTDLPAFNEFLARGEPLCGRLQHEKLDALFHDAAIEVRSAVLLPIAQIGLLAVGSREPNRFHPGMGTVFLKLIAEAIAVAIGRYPKSA